MDGDDKGLVTMTDTVERCYLDLKKINSEDEINCSTFLSFIERLMSPLQEKVRAVLMDEDFSNNVQGCGQDFKRLMKHLLTQ